MNRLATMAALVVLLMPPASAQEAGKFVVLDGQHARTVLRQCSRPSPETFTGTWELSESDIKELEVNLPRVQHLKSTLCCNKAARVKDVRDYYRQYVGIVVGNRKVIYINAFASGLLDVTGRKNRWRSEPMLACDGGSAFWGAIYDPETKTFSDLAFNGEA
jgi:hypothetical protein